MQVADTLAEFTEVASNIEVQDLLFRRSELPTPRNLGLGPANSGPLGTGNSEGLPLSIALADV